MAQLSPPRFNLVAASIVQSGLRTCYLPISVDPDSWSVLLLKRYPSNIDNDSSQ